MMGLALQPYYLPALEPNLQYGALGLLGCVVFSGMVIVFYLAQALIAKMSAVSSAMLQTRESLGEMTSTLGAMRDSLQSAVTEMRYSVLELDRGMSECTCKHRAVQSGEVLVLSSPRRR